MRAFRGCSPLHQAARVAALLLAALALMSSGGCGEDESCNCYCTDEAKECAASADGRTGCALTFQILACSPSGCCKYCCDR